MWYNMHDSVHDVSDHYIDIDHWKTAQILLYVLIANAR